MKGLPSFPFILRLNIQSSKISFYFNPSMLKIWGKISAPPIYVNSHLSVQLGTVEFAAAFASKLGWENVLKGWSKKAARARKLLSGSFMSKVTHNSWQLKYTHNFITSLRGFNYLRLYTEYFWRTSPFQEL